VIGELAPDLTRYLMWAGVVALGAILAALDRRLLGRPLLGLLLVAGLVGGFIVTTMSPFSFGGGSYYMEGVILSGASALALIGYALAILVALLAALLRHASRRR
jgi:hypothetical protein